MAGLGVRIMYSPHLPAASRWTSWRLSVYNVSVAAFLLTVLRFTIWWESPHRPAFRDDVKQMARTEEPFSGHSFRLEDVVFTVYSCTPCVALTLKKIRIFNRLLQKRCFDQIALA